MSTNNQRTLGDGGEAARHGVKAETEHKADCIGTAELSAGEPVQTWENYGLEMVPILHNGEDTGRRFVRQDGNYIADVSDRYKLLPNERAVEVADKVAEDLGAKPFDKHTGDWYIELDDHVFQDEERRRVHALYSFDAKQVGDSNLDYGFAVHNSIDKSLAFNVSLFTFRHACANMVTIGINGQGMNFDNREVLAHHKQKHTQALDVENLELLIRSALTMVDDVHETYEEWRDEFLRVEDVKQLVRYFRNSKKTLPDWMEKVAEEIEAQQAAAAENNERFTDDDADDIIRDRMPNTTVWENYNDLTENIWHDDGSNDKTKMRKFDKLHRVHAPQMSPDQVTPDG